MSFLKKGPEIKLSSLKPSSLKMSGPTADKVPGPIKDVYYDLRDRRLLPLVAILLVGIVAVPIALSDSSETNPVATAPITSAEDAKATSSIVVSTAQPGLRDYHTRLEHLTPIDPFRPAPTEESGEGSGGEGEASPEAEGGGESGSSGESSGGSNPETLPPGKVVYFTWAIDARYVPVTDAHGKKATGKPFVRHDLPPFSMLPSESTPAFTYMGPTKDGKKAVMLVSDDVNAVFGDNFCAVGNEICQLLVLEPNTPETVALGKGEKTFRIELLKIERITTDELNTNELGHQPGKSNAGASLQLAPRRPAP
jgi:hypothetical protein